MKQLAQYQDGRLELQDVPAPTPPPGGILVRVTHSVISPGTEKMKVEQARMSLLQKAKARPDQVKKVLDTARTLGWKAALEKVKNRLESPTPLGYSAAGIVEARLWQSDAPWLDSVQAARPFWLQRSLAAIPITAGFMALAAGLMTGPRGAGLRTGEPGSGADAAARMAPVLTRAGEPA